MPFFVAPRRAARFVGPAVGLGLASLTSLASLSACDRDGPPRSQLVLAFQTDLKLPDDVAQVLLSVESRGELVFAESYKVGPSGVKLPATLTLHDPNDGAKPVTVRIVALSPTNQPRVLRETLTTIPQRRSALLRVPIQWLCYDDASLGNVDAVKAVATEPPRIVTRAAQSACPADAAGGAATCGGGRCLPATVDSSLLPDFEAPKVYGGGDESGGGACFDVSSCFGVGTLAVPDEACTLPAPADGERFSVALRLATGKSGVCDAAQCWIALDAETDEGWRRRPDGRIELPPAVCARKLEVVTTTACKTKRADLPACGPWSSVGGSSERASGGTAFVPDGGAADAEPVPSAAPAEFASPDGAPLVAAATATRVVWATQAGDLVRVHACDRARGCTTPDLVFSRGEANVEVKSLAVVNDVVFLHTLSGGTRQGVYGCPVAGGCGNGVLVRLTESPLLGLEAPRRAAGRNDLLFATPTGVDACDGVQLVPDFCVTPTNRLAATQLSDVETRPQAGQPFPYATYGFDGRNLVKCTGQACTVPQRLDLGTNEGSTRISALTVTEEDPPTATWLTDVGGTPSFRACTVGPGEGGAAVCAPVTVRSDLLLGTTHRIPPRGGAPRWLYAAVRDGAGVRLVAQTWSQGAAGPEVPLSPALLPVVPTGMFTDDDDPAAVYLLTPTAIVRAVVPPT